MDKLPELERLSEHEKDARIAALWAQVQRLHARPTALEAKQPEPRKNAHTPSVPLSHTPKANLSTGPHTGTHREAHGGRAGGGRPLHPHPGPGLVAQAKSCPHCGGVLQAYEQHPHAVYAAACAVVNTGKRQGLSPYQAIRKVLSPLGSLFEAG
jgi:hypothetical protein